MSTFTTLFLTIAMLLAPCCNLLPTASAKPAWIKVGYWNSNFGYPISDINSALFTHLMCAYADINSSTYQLSIPPEKEKQFSNFTNTVKQRNPHIMTLVSISTDGSVFSSMVSQSSYRKAFIDSSITKARFLGFHGLDLCWPSDGSYFEMDNLVTLLDEWRAAIEAEAGHSANPKLILTMPVSIPPYLGTASFPIESMRNNLDWVAVAAFGYYNPSQSGKFTAAPAALYDPGSQTSTDHLINAWIDAGFPSRKLVLGLTFTGYAWTLVDPNNTEIGAPAKGPGITEWGRMTYKEIKEFMRRNAVPLKYNATYITNYCYFRSYWIAFDDVEVVKIKVAYARQKNLQGYYLWEVSRDDNWLLSQAAAQADGYSLPNNDDQDGHSSQNNDHPKTRHKLLIILVPAMAIAMILVLIYATWYLQKRVYRRGNMLAMPSVGNTDDPNMLMFYFSDIVEATDNFSFENKLGQGGYGPVYKGKLKNGTEIAVKRLSKTSEQGYEEFKNEVTLTAKLQHVNLVKVLGFCVERQEQMLIYEYMPKKSLDYYIYHPIRRLELEWEKRVQIIEGVVQGLLYLQEYSRFIIIHRDLKAGNILLDSEMKPKISDFGMARLFQKDKLEANTSKIVGTKGYVPPEYIERGIYSTKSDVYSFGVLLLQIISGKHINNCSYGQQESLYLLEYAYELWQKGKGMEFMDPSLDDTNSSCKLMRCMQMALLCVQANPVDRPSMLEVSSLLLNETGTINAPKKPPLLAKRGESMVLEFSSQQEASSVDDATITQVMIR